MRLPERLVEAGVEFVRRFELANPSLTARVGGLDHAGKADSSRGCLGFLERARRPEAWLRHARLLEPPSHVDLVGQHARGFGADAPQSEILGNGCHCWHGSVGRDREHAVRADTACGLDRDRNFAEVDRLEDVGIVLRDGLRVPVEGDHAVAERLRAQDGGALVASGAEHEDRLHLGRNRSQLRQYTRRVALSGKRIVVTGGAGFIGTTLARRLVDENEVVALDNLHRDALSGTDLLEHPNFSFHEADVLDAAALVELARGATHIVHAAAIAGVDTVLEMPVKTMHVNLIGTYHALEAALATLDTLERFVDFSTSEVFGTQAINVQEGHVTTTGSVGEARWTYAVSKLAGEHMAHAYHDELGLPTATVRPFNVYGPGQIGGGAIRAFIEAALAGDDLTIHGDGSQIRAWCYVDDMVEALLLTLEREEAIGQTFNVGNPRSTVTILDLAQRVKRLSGCPGEIVFKPLGYVDVEIRIPNVNKARELLGWEAQVDLDEGLTRTLAWYRAKLASPA